MLCVFAFLLAVPPRDFFVGFSPDAFSFRVCSLSRYPNINHRSMKEFTFPLFFHTFSIQDLFFWIVVFELLLFRRDRLQLWSENGSWLGGGTEWIPGSS